MISSLMIAFVLIGGPVLDTPDYWGGYAAGVLSVDASRLTVNIHEGKTKKIPQGMELPLPKTIEIPVITKGKQEELPSDYDLALKYINDHQANLLIVFGNLGTCSACISIEKDVFSESDVVLYLDNANTLLLRVDPSRSPGVATKYNVRQIPYYVYINNKGEVIKEGSGYRSKDNFIQWMR